jgi:hypothetical protein
MRHWGGREIEVKFRACLRDLLKVDITPFTIGAKLGFHEAEGLKLARVVGSIQTLATIFFKPKNPIKTLILLGFFH